MGTGLLVTEITGYAGIDSVSGDFSVPIKGFYVENGSTVHPVNEVLIAGNFYQMMKDVQALGDALRIGSGSVLCPAMLFPRCKSRGNNARYLRFSVRIAMIYYRQTEIFFEEE